MKSKESLKEICYKCECTGKYTQTACPWRSISNDYCEAVETIEKDLELLEKYKELVNEYASIQGKNLRVSIEEIVKDFRELEYDKTDKKD